MSLRKQGMNTNIEDEPDDDETESQPEEDDGGDQTLEEPIEIETEGDEPTGGSEPEPEE